MTLVDKIDFLYLLVAGGVVHLFVDWFLQNHWQAINKMKRRERIRRTAITQNIGGHDEVVDVIDTLLPSRWWDRHNAAYTHAGLHALFLLIVFPLWAALLICVLHLIIDTRSPLDWWGKFTRQTVDREGYVNIFPSDDFYRGREEHRERYLGIGTHVGIWRDQTAHIIVLALVSLLCVF